MVHCQPITGWRSPETQLNSTQLNSSNNMNSEDMTHEQLANKAIRTGKAYDNGELIEAGRELQTLVDNEEDSQEQADKVIELLRA